MFKTSMTCANYNSQGSSIVNPRTCAMITGDKQTCAYNASS